MIKIILSVIFCSLVLTSNTSFIYSQTQSGQDSSRITRIKAKIIKRESREDTRASIELTNGKTLKGYISQTNDNSFTLTDVKTNQKTSILYTDVAQVRGGFPNSAKIGILAGVAIAGIILAATVYKLYNN